MNRDDTRERKGHSCPETHTNKREKDWATVACLLAKQGLGIYIDESESIVIHGMLHREREGGNKGNKVEVEVESLAGNRAHSVICEESLVF
jgi:hypothetical protein